MPLSRRPILQQADWEIPFDIGFLQVSNLSLQGNQLTGIIPYVIGLMQALAVLRRYGAFRMSDVNSGASR